MEYKTSPEEKSVKPFSFELFQKLGEKLNQDQEYLATAAGLSGTINFEYEGLPEKLYLEIENGNLNVLKIEKEAQINILITKDGWERLLTGESVEKLYILRKFVITGEYIRMIKYLNALMYIINTLRTIE